MKKSIPEDISGVLSTFPTASRKTLLKVRQLILECAAADDAIGTLTETLKWGEPAYLTEQTKSGSTIRLGVDEHKPDSVAIYVNCQTTLVTDIQSKFPGVFECKNNRAIYLPASSPLPTDVLSECLSMALKYHLNKKQRAAGLI